MGNVIESEVRFAGKPGIFTILEEEASCYLVSRRLRSRGRLDVNAYPGMQQVGPNEVRGRVAKNDPNVVYFVRRHAQYKGIRLFVMSRYRGKYSLGGMIIEPVHSIPNDLLINQSSSHLGEVTGEVVVGDPQLVFYVGSDATYRGFEVHIEDEKDNYFTVKGRSNSVPSDLLLDMEISPSGEFHGRIPVSDRELTLARALET